jgi:helix-turn-helix protein
MNEIEIQNSEQKIEELTLLLIALTSWKEKIYGDDVTRAWKGYDFNILDNLTEKGYISGSKKSKSVILTDEGLKKANELIKKYLKREN